MEPATDTYRFPDLREQPELKGAAAAWFHAKWGVPEEAYLACMDAFLKHETELGWYLCMDGERIVAGLGVIENDFHDRKDLSPNICAVYTEEAYRGCGIAGHLLTIAVDDLRSKGITPVYLVTNHVGFYERYSWEFLCMVRARPVFVVGATANRKKAGCTSINERRKHERH
jgi:GNAT superfamily N-acetyltransferase